MSAGRGKIAIEPAWKKAKQEPGPRIHIVPPPPPPVKPAERMPHTPTPEQSSPTHDPESDEAEKQDEGPIRPKEEEDGGESDGWGDQWGGRSDNTGTSEEWTGKQEGSTRDGKRERAKRVPGQPRRGAKRDAKGYGKDKQSGGGGAKGSKQGMQALVAAASSHTGSSAEMFCYVIF